MTRFLASVASATEAAVALGAGADLIDVKDPITGALGAASLNEIRSIVGVVRKRTPVSATIGDLPMEPDVIGPVVRATMATGVDYVKIGVFQQGDACATIESLRNLTAGGVKLAAVLFADRKPNFELIDLMADVGFAAVMVDTAGKKSGRLIDCLDAAALDAFIAHARRRGLLAGLAGSLRAEDIPALLPLNPDILGFRGALCVGADRTASLSRDKVRAIRQLFDASLAARNDNNNDAAPEAA
jgi:(5-formylfuran-3-yl)methyl phosphate synthase